MCLAHSTQNNFLFFFVLDLDDNAPIPKVLVEERKRTFGFFVVKKTKNQKTKTKKKTKTMSQTILLNLPHTCRRLEKGPDFSVQMYQSDQLLWNLKPAGNVSECMFTASENEDNLYIWIRGFGNIVQVIDADDGSTLVGGMLMCSTGETMKFFEVF